MTMKNAAPDVRESFRQAIIRRIENNIINSPYVIHNQLIGVAGQESLLKVWSRVIKSRHKFLSSRDSALIREQFEYFNGLQACMMLLRVEYYNAVGADASADNAFQAYQENIEAQSALLKEPVPDNMLIDRDQNIMIYEGDYITWKTYKTKAPFYLKYWEAGDKVNEWNAAKHAGYNNWRLFTQAEIQKLCTNRGSLVPREYLERQGWVNPLPTGMYFATQYEVSEGREYYRGSNGRTSKAKVATEIFKYKVFQVDDVGGAFFNQMTEYFRAGQEADVGFFFKTVMEKVVGGRNTVHIPNYHWNIVRTMGAGEFGKYFW